MPLRENKGTIPVYPQAPSKRYQEKLNKEKEAARVENSPVEQAAKAEAI